MYKKKLWTLDILDSLPVVWVGMPGRCDTIRIRSDGKVPPSTTVRYDDDDDDNVPIQYRRRDADYFMLLLLNTTRVRADTDDETTNIVIVFDTRRNPQRTQVRRRTRGVVCYFKPTRTEQGVDVQNVQSILKSVTVR